jgi:hypothetical protein
MREGDVGGEIANARGLLAPLQNPTWPMYLPLVTVERSHFANCLLGVMVASPTVL